MPHLKLRIPEPTDLDFLYEQENDLSIWEVSNTRIPFSKNTLRKYLDTTHDIYNDRQLRLIIEKNGKRVGVIDLFDFEPFHQRAGVGISIVSNFRNQGLASAALMEIKDYAAKHLGLKQLFCHILVSNTVSIKLFEKCGFTISGVLKSWHRSTKGQWEDVSVYQCKL